MALYYGELHLEGDSDRLPAVVKVELGSLTLSSGRTELGSWKLYEVRILDLGDRAVLTADEENVVLFLSEHRSFMGEVERFVDRPDDKKRRRRERRRREHPAFETKEPKRRSKKPKKASEAEPATTSDEPAATAQPQEPKAAALRQELVEEARPIVEDAKRLIQKVNPGPVFWGVVGAFIAAFIFFPSVLFGVLLTVGLATVLVGVIGYMDNTIAARFPNRLPPTRLMLGGGFALVVAILVILIR